RLESGKGKSNYRLKPPRSRVGPAPGDTLLRSVWTSEVPLSPLPRCPQDPVAGQLLSDLFTNRKENITLKLSEDCLYLNIYTPADLTKKSRLPVLSPLAKNLFHRAISQSGVALTSALLKKDNIKPLAEKVAITAGCKTTTSAVMVHCLRQKTEEELLETTLKMHELCMNHVFSDAGAPTYMYEFGYRPSFSSDMKPKTVRGDHGDELFSVFGAPFLKGNGGTEDPVKKKDLFLDLIGDVIFGVRSVTVARRHRGESQRLDCKGTSAPPAPSHPFMPMVVDGVLLPKTPEEILAEKSFNTVPYIVGINKQEFGWIIPMVSTCSLLDSLLSPSALPGLATGVRPSPRPDLSPGHLSPPSQVVISMETFSGMAQL
ncbi:PREDICTED: liver carboxylesterase 1-like, partial [Propithecus coquereli]|uniref:liver carboxylesterase 1-like n=1 Tax=Propithecus coquereli TaxID=379532 RepID=UPI00063F9965